MRRFVLLIALAPAAASAQAPADRFAASCKPGADRVSARPVEPGRPRPLIEMPDARPVLTVYRQVGGCPVILVREGGRIVEERVDRPEIRRTFRP